MTAPAITDTDAYTTTTGSTSYSTSFSVTNSDALVLVLANFSFAATSPSDRWITGVTIGGTAANESLNYKAASTNRRYASGLYWLNGVSSGSQTVTVTASSTFNDIVIYIVEIEGHDTSDPILQADGFLLGTSGATATVSMTTAESDSLWIGSSRIQDGANTLTPAGGVTEIAENSSAGDASAVVANLLSRSGSGTYNIGSTASAAANGYGVMAIEIAAAPTGSSSKPHLYYAMMAAN